jgi:hypothetical protein
MKRIGIAAIVGGIVLYIWAFISWMYIPWHLMGAVPDEDAVRTVLSESGAESGIYHVPGLDYDALASMTDEQKEAAEEAVMEKYREGPRALLVYKADGANPMSPVTMVIGFVLEVLVAAVIAGLLTMAVPALPGFGSRVGFVMLIGVLTIVGTNLMNWNYMHYPMRFTLEMAADGLVASLLLGIVLAIIIKPYTALSEVDDVADIEAAADA